MGVYLMGVYLMGMYLIGMYLVDVYFLGRVSHRRVLRGRALHWACTSLGVYLIYESSLRAGHG